MGTSAFCRLVEGGALRSGLFRTRTSAAAFIICMISLIVSILGLFYLYEKFKDSVENCYLITFIFVFVSIVLFGPFLSKEIGLRKLFLFVVIQGGADIFMFAAIYRGYGLISPDGSVAPPWKTALYFSIVTWTTLGYGDYRPPEAIQLIAAIQALLGYVFLGLTVSVLAISVDRRNS